MLLKERSFADCLLIWKFIQKSCFLDRLFACWFLRKLWASSFARSVKFLSLHSDELATEVVLHGTFRLDSKIHSQNVYCHHSFWSEQTLAATKLFLSLTRIDFVVAVSSRAVPISSRAVCVFPALSLRRVQPSYGTFSLMVFQGNCARGNMGHLINMYNMYSTQRIVASSPLLIQLLLFTSCWPHYLNAGDRENNIFQSFL